MPTDADSLPPRPASASAAGYRSLRVWQRALDLAVDAAPLARTLAAEGLGGLANDLVRAGTAVPAHIAAGSVAATRADHQRALGSAMAAVARFETLVVAAERLAPQTGSGCAALLVGTGEVTRLLRAFARAIGGTPASSTPSGSRPRPEAVAADADERTPSTPDVAPPAGAVTPDAAPADPPPAPEPALALAGAAGMTPPMSARPARVRCARTADPRPRRA